MVGKSQITLAGRQRLRVVNVRLTLPPSSNQFSVSTTKFPEEYVIWCGQEGTRNRFNMLRETLSKFISERSGKQEMEVAVDDWNDDLLWLMSEFIEEAFLASSL